METLLLPPSARKKIESYLNVSTTSHPLITDPKFNHPPGEWKRFSKNRRKKIKSNFRKTKNHATTINTSTSKNPVSAILDCTPRNLAPKVRIRSGYKFDPNDPIASTLIKVLGDRACKNGSVFRPLFVIQKCLVCFYTTYLP